MKNEYKVRLTAKIIIESEDLHNSIDSVLYFGTNTDLPFIPQINSYIALKLHSYQPIRREFKVTEVVTPLGRPSSRHTDDKRFELVDKIEVLMETSTKFSDMLWWFEFDDMDDLYKKCKEYEWDVYKKD